MAMAMAAVAAGNQVHNVFVYGSLLADDHNLRRCRVLHGITDPELYILDEFEDVEYERVTVDVFLMVNRKGKGRYSGKYQSIEEARLQKPYEKEVAASKTVPAKDTNCSAGPPPVIFAPSNPQSLVIFHVAFPVPTAQACPSKIYKNSSMELNGCNLENRNRGSHDDSEEDNCVPFDIENSRRRNSDVDSDVNGIAIDSLSSRKSPPTPVSAADILKTLFFILVWYTFSTFLTLYNKTLLGDDMGRFPAPLLMNTVHFTMQAVLSTAITWYWSDRFRPNVAMSWKDYFIRVVPTALGTAFDVNLSNVSLVFISVTFATMCKSAAPIFLILFAFAFRLEYPSAKLFGIIMVISVGILLTVAKETEFEFWGFVFVMLAAVMSGFRWCMTQILLQV
ncbi:sugar phosphate/phosphate translocator [Populus alba x Populus x berolinensis]|nr:sugar phosphate/phosphate translocator [Populus alba x Populus x berolinensis]